MGFWDDVIGKGAKPAWVKSGGLVSLIREGLGETRKIPPPSPEVAYRASGLHKICPRAEVLAGRHDIAREETVSPELELIFGMGHGAHYILQNRILPKLEEQGVRLYGYWRCYWCGKQDEDAPPIQVGGLCVRRRPSKCSACGAGAFDYEEVSLNSGLISGHPDGILTLPGEADPVLLEIKTISSTGFSGVQKEPKQDHVIQANIYMGLLGLQEAIILYWNKGGYGDNMLCEHRIQFNPSLYNGIVQKVETIRKCLGDETEPLPERTCESETCSTAKACPLVELCFSK